MNTEQALSLAASAALIFLSAFGLTALACLP